MKTDIEIARSKKMKNIEEIAKKLKVNRLTLGKFIKNNKLDSLI